MEEYAGFKQEDYIQQIDIRTFRLKFLFISAMNVERGRRLSVIFATSARFPSFSPMIYVRTLFIPSLLSGITIETCLSFFFLIKLVTLYFSCSTQYLTQ